jgi:hypothetical protein
MLSMDLPQDMSQIRGKFLQHILTGQATEGDGAPLPCVGQVVPSGWKIGVANKSAGCGPGKV